MLCALTLNYVFCGMASGAVSYLLVQGPFGAGDAVETYKWKVNYDPGQLVTGQDLLNVVFGIPADSGTNYTDGFGGTNPYFVSSNGSQLGAGYINFSFGPFLESFTIKGKKVAQSIFYSPSWSYYNGGGVYPNENWFASDTGTGSRNLTNGSFDGFVFGTDSGDPNYVPPAIVGTENSPQVTNFLSATLIDISGAPEPGRTFLLLIGAGSLVMRRRRMSEINE